MFIRLARVATVGVEAVEGTVTSSFGQVASGPDAGILKLSGTSVNDPFLFTVGSGAARRGSGSRRSAKGACGGS